MDCLVTKLKGSINDESLLKLGEIRISKSKYSGEDKSSQCFELSFNKSVILQIIGDGYFTDENLTENQGKSKSVEGNDTNVKLYVSNDDFQLSISDKYSLTKMDLNPSTPLATSIGTKILLDGIDSLKFSKNIQKISLDKGNSGNLSSISELKELTTLYLAASSVTGDIKNLANLNKLEIIQLNNSVSGDIAVLANMEKLSIFQIVGQVPSIYGNISSLVGKSSLQTFVCTYNHITGDISSFSDCVKLKTLSIGTSDVYGDISSVVSPLTSFNCNNTKITGTIESFVQTQRSHGRTSGSCLFEYGYPSSVTFNENVIEAGKDTLTWTSTQITCKNKTITA